MRFAALLFLSSCASLAGIGADVPPEGAKKPDEPKGASQPTVSDQDGSTPVADGPDASLPPSTTCTANLAIDPNNCGWCDHRCLGSNTCRGGLCDSTLVATATSIDSVALTPTSVLVGDKGSGKVRACARGDTADLCQIVVAGTGVGGAVSSGAGRVMYFDSQSAHLFTCLETGCTNDTRNDLGSVDASGGGAPGLAVVGQWAFWTTPSAVVASNVFDHGQREVDNRLVATSRIAAAAAADESVTLAGATSSGVWAVRLDDAFTTLNAGDKHMVTTSAANDVSVDAKFIWLASNDGLFRATHDGAVAKVRTGAFVSVSAQDGVAFAVKQNGDLLRVQDGAPDELLLAKNAVRVVVDAADRFVYFTTGGQVRRVPR